MQSPSDPNTPKKERSLSFEPVYIVGAGRVGTALMILLKRAHIRVSGFWSKSLKGARRASDLTQISCAHGPFPKDIAEARTIIISVPDRFIPIVAGALQDGGLLRSTRAVLHCCGSADAHTALAHLAQVIPKGTMHPLLAVANSEQAVVMLPKSYFAIEGDEEAIHAARHLVEAMGGHFILLQANQMIPYHTAAVMASNFAITLWHASQELLQKINVTPAQAQEMLVPLLHSTLANAQHLGIPEALTGPIRRGDTQTVERHLQALQMHAPELFDLYRACAKETIRVAEKTPEGLSNIQAFEAIRRLIS